MPAPDLIQETWMTDSNREKLEKLAAAMCARLDAHLRQAYTATVKPGDIAPGMKGYAKITHSVAHIDDEDGVFVIQAGPLLISIEPDDGTDGPKNI